MSRPVTALRATSAGRWELPIPTALCPPAAGAGTADLQAKARLGMGAPITPAVASPARLVIAIGLDLLPIGTVAPVVIHRVLGILVGVESDDLRLRPHLRRAP